MAAQAYERGTQATLLTATASGGANAQVGTAAPTAAAVFGIVPTVARAQQPTYIGVQVDVVSGSITALEVDLLGSYDGINFYVIGKVTGLTAGTIFTAGVGVSTSINFPVPLRYISAAIPSGTITAGQVKVSFVI